MKGELKSKAQLIYKEFITNAHTHTHAYTYSQPCSLTLSYTVHVLFFLFLLSLSPSFDLKYSYKCIHWLLCQPANTFCPLIGQP